LSKIRIFLTGVGGTMGGSTLRQLLKHESASDYEIVGLDLPTPDNKHKLEQYEKLPNFSMVWGDLTNYNDVLSAVEGADFVLHPAAFISPAADHHPELAWRVNTGSAENIVRAIKAQPHPDAVRLVTIGTVAATGDRLPPIHVGRTGDPLKPSVFDIYACSKIAAERLVAESGLRYWVSLRQTYITTPQAITDPIMYHQPLNTCIELCTEHDAGLVLANVVKYNPPDDFWRRFYNIGGGPRARFTYLEYLEKVFKATSAGDMRKIFEPNWFALRNFHCQWFEDSYILNQYLHHQTEGLDEAIAHMVEAMSGIQRLVTKLSPPSVIRKRVFEPLATEKSDSPYFWIENDVEDRISAFFKDKEAFEAIPGWDGYGFEYPDWYSYVRLDHGYDESKPSAELNIDDMRSAASFRGGECLSQSMTPGDLFTPLTWKCAFGHTFEATPNLVLKGGHWCPECAPPPWNHDAQAKVNPFFAQVWYPNHDPEEDNVYPGPSPSLEEDDSEQPEVAATNNTKSPSGDF